MTDININEMFYAEHERARSSRAGDGFKDESFMPHAIVVIPGGKIIMIACPFANNSEKMMAMNYLWMTARKEKALAVFFSADSRQINNEVYCAHYGIPLEEFFAHRDRILGGTNGSYTNLPREVWNDSIVTWAMGPDLPDGLLTTVYNEGPDDTVVFGATVDNKDNKVNQHMMTKWW